MNDLTVRSYCLVDTDSQQALQEALAVLRQEQYYTKSITLYSRLRHGFFTAHSHLLILQIGPEVASLSSTPWLIAFVDRSRRRETQLWMSGSWETVADTDKTTVQTLLKALFSRVKELGLPPSIHDTSDTQHASGDQNEYRPEDNILTCGAVHDSTFRIIKETSWIAAAYTHMEVPYQLFLFDIDKLPAARELREDLKWGSLETHDYALVRTTSKIPRQDSTLAVQPSVAVLDRSSREPVAWGFIGFDGSLSTLYVVPEYRGMGLGMTVLLKLLKEKMGGVFTAEDKRLGHSYVASDNDASARTALRAGGVKAENPYYWIRIDLDMI